MHNAIAWAAAASLRVENVLISLVENIATGLLFIMVADVFIGILDRFTLGLGLPWPGELARYLLIWVSMLSAAIALPKGHHYVIDVFYRKFIHTPGRRTVGEFGSALVNLITIAVLFQYSLQLTLRVSWQTAPALQISMSWVYASLPTAFALMILFFACQILMALERHCNFKVGGGSSGSSEEVRK